MAKKASEADAPPPQDESSEAKKVQDSGSEGGDGKVQEQDVEALKEKLLEDESFLDSVLDTEHARKRTQGERDTFAHEQTLPLKRQLEEATRLLDENTRANDPIRTEIELLKQEGKYEEALRLAEEQQALAVRESAAETRGRQDAGREILERVSKNPAFADLATEDWRTVYANAATEAKKQGRDYIMVDEYVAEASRVLRGKERVAVAKEQDDGLQQKINEGVEAALKERGIEKREDEGGGETIEGGGGGGGRTPSYRTKTEARALHVQKKISNDEMRRVNANSSIPEM